MMEIFCCHCENIVTARLTTGKEIYPHRKDLHKIPFWKCDTCLNYVGTHHKTKEKHKPLGCIPTKEIRENRKKIHKILDVLWKTKKISRHRLYAELSCVIDRNYHTGELRNIEECNRIYEHLLDFGEKNGN